MSEDYNPFGTTSPPEEEPELDINGNPMVKGASLAGSVGHFAGGGASPRVEPAVQEHSVAHGASSHERPVSKIESTHVSGEIAPDLGDGARYDLAGNLLQSSGPVPSAPAPQPTQPMSYDGPTDLAGNPLQQAPSQAPAATPVPPPYSPPTPPHYAAPPRQGGPAAPPPRYQGGQSGPYGAPAPPAYGAPAAQGSPGYVESAYGAAPGIAQPPGPKSWNVFAENSSGTQGDVPPEIARLKWNWAAYFIGRFWCVKHGMRAMASFLWGIVFGVKILGTILANGHPVLVAGIYVAVDQGLAIWLGLVGHKQAWRNRRFDDGVDQFFKVQQKWMIAALILGPFVWYTQVYVRIHGAIVQQQRLQEDAAYDASLSDSYGGNKSLYGTTGTTGGSAPTYGTTPGAAAPSTGSSPAPTSADAPGSSGSYSQPNYGSPAPSGSPPPYGGSAPADGSSQSSPTPMELAPPAGFHPKN